MNADGSDKRQLTDSPMSEDGWWSPDGSRIAYVSYSQGIFDKGKKSKEDKSEIWVMNADGSDKQLLLSVPYRYGLIEELEWSPDGTKLAFVWDPNVEGVDKDIYLIDVPGS
jgi:Tol biopolymer transport system component